MTARGAPFRVSKSLNSSVVLVTDANDYEWLLFGKGIGYGRSTGDLIDPDAADRAFIPLSASGAADHIQALSFLTPERLQITEEIVQLAESRLSTELNKYILVALTDHLAFVLDRAHSGNPIPPSPWWEVQDLYPHEHAVAVEALSVIERRTGTQLPPHEAVSITLHLVNAEQSSPGMSTVMKVSAFLDWFGSFIDQQTSTVDSKARGRLMRHGRAFYQRLLAGEFLDGDVSALIRDYRTREPRVMEVVDDIAKHVQSTSISTLPEEEQLHLALYLKPILEPTR